MLLQGRCNGHTLALVQLLATALTCMGGQLGRRAAGAWTIPSPNPLRLSPTACPVCAPADALCVHAPQVRDWIQSLEAFPLVDPGAWGLVLSYPRAIVEPGQRVAEAAHGAKQVAFFVELK